MPDFILNAPELAECDGPYFTAYVTLDSCRPPSFSGVSSIPWDKIVQYGREYLQLEGEDLQSFVDIMMLVDNLFIAKIVADRETK